MIAQDGVGPKVAGVETAEGVIIVDLSLRPVAFDSGAEVITGIVDGENSAPASIHYLPPALISALDGRSPKELIRSRLRVEVGGVSYNCRVFWMEPFDSGLDEPLLAIHLKRQLSVDEAVRRVAGAYRLTEREQQAVIGVSMGLTSKELAAWMNISFNTVNTFLRTIMAKMGVATRAGVVGKLLEQNTSPPRAYSARSRSNYGQ